MCSKTADSAAREAPVMRPGERYRFAHQAAQGERVRIRTDIRQSVCKLRETGVGRPEYFMNDAGLPGQLCRIEMTY